jgi:replicative DNA helicase
VIINDRAIRIGISLISKIKECHKEDEDLDMQLDFAERDLLTISQQSGEDDFVHVSRLLEETYKRAEGLNKDPGRLRGIPTGFKCIDNLLGGLQKSDLVILAARPSIGKTSLALDIARHVAQGKRVLAFFP